MSSTMRHSRYCRTSPSGIEIKGVMSSMSEGRGRGQGSAREVWGRSLYSALVRALRILYALVKEVHHALGHVHRARAPHHAYREKWRASSQSRTAERARQSVPHTQGEAMWVFTPKWVSASV